MANRLGYMSFSALILGLWLLPGVVWSSAPNLNSEKDPMESVHLCDYPQHDSSWIDMDLITNVDSLKKCVELGRSARSQSKVKIRQPLSKVSYAIENDRIASFIEDN